MRAEKKYLVEEVDRHLGKSDYLFLADYQRITVPETAELRSSLAAHDAEFHVVKNSVLNVAAKARNLPDLSEWLSGQVAVVSGGSNPSEVAKALKKFTKKTDKGEVKGGILSGEKLEAAQVSELATLPSLDELRAKLLSLFNTPAQQFVTVLEAVPKSMLNVLNAKSEAA